MRLFMTSPTRYFPELAESARTISESQARKLLVAKYFASVGAATARQTASLFHWTAEITERTLSQLVRENQLQADLTLEDQKDSFLCHPDTALRIGVTCKFRSRL